MDKYFNYNVKFDFIYFIKQFIKQWDNNMNIMNKTAIS